MDLASEKLSILQMDRRDALTLVLRIRQERAAKLIEYSQKKRAKAPAKKKASAKKKPKSAKDFVASMSPAARKALLASLMEE